MTCYLTSRDHRFAAAVAGGVVSDLTSMAGTSDAGHFLGEHELGGAPWARPDRYAAMSPLSQVDQVRTPTLILHGAADLRCPVGPGRAVAHRPARSGACRPGWCSTRRASHLFVLEGPPSHRVDYNRRIVDWVRAVRRRPGRPAPARDRRRALAAPARRAGRSGTGCPAPRSASCASADGPAPDELVEAAHGVLNMDTGVDDDHRLGVPDRLDLEGLDRDAGDAARRRGQARPRRADRRRAARAAAGRRRRRPST